MPELDIARLRALVFCKKFEKKADGITLTGVHDTRFSGSFPVKFDELFLYVSFEVSSPRTVSMLLQFRVNDGSIQDFANSEADIDDDLVVTSPLDLSQWEFTEPGRYSFALYVDGVLVGSTSLTIHNMMRDEVAFA